MALPSLWNPIARTTGLLLLTVFLASFAQSARTSSDTAVDRLLRPDGRLRFPADYREWIFLSAGHGMSYSATATAAEPLPFDNVFVDPSAYRDFIRTGEWPDGTVFALEIRPGRSDGSINKRGSFQHGEPTAIEVHAKDRRFPSGWAFYDFSQRRPAARIPESAECYSCHQANGAVQTTFVQFYPTLLPIAANKDTLSAAYRKAEAAADKE